ncbi:extracellular solute-binding protein [Yinghuangia soli]|uniref:Extracellular solute-binding protein n=1 Tax=Yinghuangia soli TaxID=2908204 RepID=A0AA41Q399_9ACTN|nr:extracellular solute-binding protein [Yinghuangia soli]MCF2529941.1 extracellular solute-binding protein [Yinghuangia soli]
MKRRLFVAAGVAAALTGVAACGSSDSGDKDKPAASGAQSNAPADGKGKKVTIWVMKGSTNDEFNAAFKAKFEADHPGSTVDIQVQQWNGIGEKITAALASNDAPDIVEAGNTQIAGYAASGGVYDLSSKVTELGGKDWIPGLAGPGKVDGKQYGVPFYAANRVVIYNKEAFAKAGVQPPKTRAEWLETTKKLNSGDQQGIYLPGQNWYFYSGLLKDEGIDLTTKNGDKWKANVGTPQGAAAATFYKDLAANGKGPKDQDEKTQPETVAAANGNIAQFIAVPGELDTVLKNNPALKGKYDFFPIPGKEAGKPGANLTGGSDLFIPEKSKNKDLAYDAIKLFNSDEMQVKLAKALTYVPSKTTQVAALEGVPGAQAQALGAQNGFVIPATVSTNWGAVEETNPLKPFLTSVLTGGNPESEGKKADEAIEKVLNTKS